MDEEKDVVISHTSQGAAQIRQRPQPVLRKRGRPPLEKNRIVPKEAIGVVRSARDVVTVCCKIPTGILIRGFRPITVMRPLLGGGSKEVTEYVPTGEECRINGCAVAFGEESPHEMRKGYAMTFNVPARLWDEWYEANKTTSMMIKNGLIWAHHQQASVEAFAREHEKARSGLERLDRNNLPQLGKAGRMAVTTADVR